jgi:hypothetical protein
MDSEPDRRRRAPRWLKLVNPINRMLLTRGIGPASQRLLTIRGRRTGRPHTTPVAVVTVNGSRYAVAGYEGSDWVRNARAVGQGLLRRGPTIEHVSLTEIPVGERVPVLREFTQRVRGGRRFLTVPARAPAEAFANSAPRHPVFRIDALGAL